MCGMKTPTEQTGRCTYYNHNITVVIRTRIMRIITAASCDVALPQVPI